MMNDIQVSFKNTLCEEPILDDQWDPMKDDFEDINTNCYDHGPGAHLDVNLQRPAYRDKNNQIVYKLMVNRIPRGLNQNGLENLFLHFGTPNVSKCFKEAPDHLVWALIEFKTLKEAQDAIMQLEGFHGMRVKFARSDEESERLKKNNQISEMIHKQAQNYLQQNEQNVDVKQNSAHLNRSLLRLGRGQNRGKLIINAFRMHQEKRPGLRNCAWSSGIPDFRDPGGLMYDSKWSRHEGTNRVLQNLVITSGTSSVRKVAMGRGFIPPDTQAANLSTLMSVKQTCIGNDVCVPLLACVKCGTETIQKCSLCGTPYCSRKCQREDFVVHKPKCNPRDSIDVIIKPETKNSVRFVPLTQNVEIKPFTDSSSLLSNRLWGKPEKNALYLLDKNIKAIVSIGTEENNMYHGVLSCSEVFEIANKLFCNLPTALRQRPVDENFWPPVGSLVAVRYDDSIWRAYILNLPIVGSSTVFTVALCDLGRVLDIEARNIMMLPSDFQELPELAVTCEFVKTQSDVASLLGPEKQLNLEVESTSDSKVTAKAMSENGSTVLGVVSLSPWKPSCTNILTPVQIVPPCQVVITSYHHQHALYVRPLGRAYQEQLFSLLQKVAAVHVTTPHLSRAPYRGEMVACRFTKNDNYYRAIVQGEDTSSTDSGQYNVFFVDYGNIESVSAVDMKALPEELKTCPCMAVKVGLVGVRQGPLTETAVQYLNVLLQKEQELRLEYSPNSDEGVQLFFQDNSSLNLKLNEFLMPEWELSLKNGHKPDGGEVFMLENFEVLPLLNGALKRGNTNVIVTNVIVDGRVAVLPDSPEMEHVLNTLAFQINEYCEATDPNISYNPRQNEVCLAKYSKDGKWYRAVNTETITATQSCQLLFLDYGNLENVQFKDIRRMVQDFVRAPTVMSICHIDGLPVEPSLDMINRLKELLPINKCYHIEVLGMIGTGEYKISIPEVSNQLKSEYPSSESS